MDNRYIFAAVKDMKLVIKDFAGGVESIDMQVILNNPKQYITHEELKALGDIVRKHINNLREHVEKEICTAMDEKEWGERDFENRLDDELLFQFNIPGGTTGGVRQAENETEVTKEMKEAGHWTESSEPEVFTREDIDRFIKHAIIKTMRVSPEMFDNMPPDYSFELTSETIDEVAGYIQKTKEEVA